MARPQVRTVRRRANYRPASASKRVSVVRFSWFVIGSLFGLILSYLINVFISIVILPQYQEQPSDASELISAETDTAPMAHKAEGAEEVADVVAPEPAKPQFPKRVALTVEKGDTLISMLVREQVDFDEAVDVIEALKKTYDPRQMRIGQEIDVKLEPHAKTPSKASVANLSIAMNKLESIELKRLPSGSFFVEKALKERKPKLVYAGGKITSSLFQTGYANGVPTGVLTELMNAYSYDVDLQRQIQQGDRMEVLFEKMVTKEGAEAGYGKIYYAMLKLRDADKRIYRFEDKDGSVGFYDEKGESVIKALLKTPVSSARISSGFGERMHPILGYTKMHKGVDFAAPRGTPVYAAGDGVIEFKGWNGGYGNFVKIAHNNKYATAYGHLSAFSPAVAEGGKVKQGQVIGYVGSTGRSTGPHLHYEIYKYGNQVNPQNEKFKTGRILKGTELAKFKREVSRIHTQLASISKGSTTVASNR